MSRPESVDVARNECIAVSVEVVIDRGDESRVFKRHADRHGRTRGQRVYARRGAEEEQYRNPNDRPHVSHVAMMRLRSIVLACLLLPLAPTPAVACSCMPDDGPEQRAARAHAIFVGRLVSSDRPLLGVRSPDDRVTFHFDVDRVVKGAVAENARVVSPTDGAMCGVSLRNGERYTVFAYDDQGQLATNLCSGTHPGDPEAALGGSSGTLLPAELEPPPIWVLVGIGLAALAATWFGRRRVMARP